MEITLELLKERGWVETEEDAPACFIEKKIENRNPLNNGEDTDISLIIHGMYNGNNFAILLPDGAMLNLNIETIEQLDMFERMIDFYDAPF